MARFADVEGLAVTYLSGALSVRVVTIVPATIAPPLVRVARAGGSDDFHNDYARLDVEVFGSSRGQMWDYAERARDAMHLLAGNAVGGRLVDTVSTDVAPFWLDYGNPAVHRAIATYRLTLRAQ